MLGGPASQSVMFYLDQGWRSICSLITQRYLLVRRGTERGGSRKQQSREACLTDTVSHRMTRRTRSTTLEVRVGSCAPLVQILCARGGIGVSTDLSWRLIPYGSTTAYRGRTCMPRISEQEDKLIMKSCSSQSGHTTSDSYKSPILLLDWLNHV
ncbi:hypothetical protein BR93DRAFT_139073 [Coniochaeta sp. PMI_546]|nr:hypothetical protein BR93DRAFT_139073 [Coniochaeta sp. PMI_546]